MLSQLVLEEKELNQFIRKPSPKTIQLWSIDHTSRIPQITSVYRPYNQDDNRWVGLKHQHAPLYSTQTILANSKASSTFSRSDWDIDTSHITPIHHRSLTLVEPQSTINYLPVGLGHRHEPSIQSTQLTLNRRPQAPQPNSNSKQQHFFLSNLKLILPKAAQRWYLT